MNTDIQNTEETQETPSPKDPQENVSESAPVNPAREFGEVDVIYADESGAPVDPSQFSEELMESIETALASQLSSSVQPFVTYTGTIDGVIVRNASAEKIASMLNKILRKRESDVTVSVVAPEFYPRMISELEKYTDNPAFLTQNFPKCIHSIAFVVNSFTSRGMKYSVEETYSIKNDAVLDFSARLSEMTGINIVLSPIFHNSSAASKLVRREGLRGRLNLAYAVILLACVIATAYCYMSGNASTPWFLCGALVLAWLIDRDIFGPIFPPLVGQETVVSLMSYASAKNLDNTQLARTAQRFGKRTKLETIAFVLFLAWLVFLLASAVPDSMALYQAAEQASHSVWG